MAPICYMIPLGETSATDLGEEVINEDLAVAGECNDEKREGPGIAARIGETDIGKLEHKEYFIFQIFDLHNNEIEVHRNKHACKGEYLGDAVGGASEIRFR